MNETRFLIDVATDLFEGYVLKMSRSEFLRLEEAGDWPEITHADRVATFERYEAENGARAYYLEDDFDNDGEEIDEYDPCLWMRPVDEAAEENCREITLEDAVRYTENHLGMGDYRIDDVRMIDGESLRSAVEAFCRNDYWKNLYENASPQVRKFLALRFLESEDKDVERSRGLMSRSCSRWNFWMNALRSMLV